MKQLSKSEISDLNRSIECDFHVPDFFGKKDRVVFIDAVDKKLVVKDKVCYFFFDGDRLVPCLRLLLERPFLKSVTVDMGAVRFVTNGADVMRPGVTRVDEGIQKGDFVVVVDETHGKPLAVCEALLSGPDIMAADGGKVLRNLHYVGDKLWDVKL